MNRLRLFACVSAVLLGFSVRASGADGAPQSARPIPAYDPHFSYQGRYDFSDPARPVVVWEASRITIDFDGDHAGVRFGGATGPVFFDASVDGASVILKAPQGTADTIFPLPVSGSGLHHLILFKRTEASAGTAPFVGIEIAAGATVYSPAAPVYRLRMEVVGDSITVGACDEDGPNDQWEDRSTHDAAFSWIALTAAAFSADYRNISVSGMGLSTGFVDVLAGQMWDQIYPTASSPKADLSAWVPEVVFVLLGDNDDSYTRANNLPFPADYGAKYISLIHAIRAGRPHASIVLLNGAMWAGTHSPELRTAWSSAVPSLESADPGISHYTFVHWTMNHPRVADHRILADELISWLRAQPFFEGNR